MSESCCIFAAEKLRERFAHQQFKQVLIAFGLRRPCTVETIKHKKKMEARTMTYPQEGMLLVKISDMSMLKDIRKAISMVKGVENVTLPRRKRVSAYERSLRDLEEGRVYEAKDVDDLFKQCLG